MSFSTYSGLKASIADYVNRTDLTSVIPDFITLAEAMMNNGDPSNDVEPIRVRQMEATATGTPSSGSFTLATDFQEMIRATYVGTVRVPLTYATPNDLDAMFGDVASGDPQFYSIIGTSFQLRPTGTSTVSYTYYQTIPALATTDPNWLLTKAPTVYLYGSLFQYSIYNQDADFGAAMINLYRGAVLGLERADRGSKPAQLVRRAAMPAW